MFVMKYEKKNILLIILFKVKIIFKKLIFNAYIIAI